MASPFIRRSRRDSFLIAKRPRLLRRVYRAPLSLSVRSLEDRRLFHPERFRRPAASVLRTDRSVREVFRGKRAVMMFSVPKRVSICVRRKERREVLFAKGKGGGGKRHPRRNYWSSVSCR